MKKYLFVEFYGYSERVEKTGLMQDIIYFENNQTITIEKVKQCLEHNFSPYRKNKTIVITKIQSL